MGGLNTTFSMAIAAIKVTLVALFFMNLRSSTNLVRLGSLAGLF
jgi:caa(3)-type oxidase subunit IV